MCNYKHDKVVYSCTIDIYLTMYWTFHCRMKALTSEAELVQPISEVMCARMNVDTIECYYAMRHIQFINMTRFDASGIYCLTVRV